MMVMSRSFNQQHGFDEASNARSATCLTNEVKKTTFPAIFRWSFGLKALAMMALFTVSLVVLPLVLPPLPPPPPLVLFVPVLIMSVLVFLAFAPLELPPDDDVICTSLESCCIRPVVRTVYSTKFHIPNKTDSKESSSDKEFITEGKNEVSKPETNIVTRSKGAIEDKGETSYIEEKVAGKRKVDEIVPKVDPVAETTKKAKLDEVTDVSEPAQEEMITFS
ncbi:hypothetical protein QVD17_17747 [Tagetes erecta]|uniref:Uncharacterized protein n=1 Tax=Tagetes erecta TaxID=13708 RepID=A0AAD8KYW4_TARER|nr:hypothetical protein QVD17_17747 [Tagetes erecta]